MKTLELTFVNFDHSTKKYEIEIPDETFNAIQDLRKIIDDANGSELPLLVQVDRKVMGAAVGVGKQTGRKAIEMSVGPDLNSFNEHAGPTLVHELGHIAVEAQGIPTLVAKNLKGQEMGSAVLDISDHPYIWSVFSDHCVEWHLKYDKERIDTVFSDKYKLQRENGFQSYTYLNAKQYADICLYNKDLYNHFKERLPSVRKGRKLRRVLDQIDEIRDHVGEEIFTISGIRKVREGLISAWSFEFTEVHNF